MHPIASRLACVLALSFAFCGTSAMAATSDHRVSHHHYKRQKHHKRTHGHAVTKPQVNEASKHPKQVCKYSVLKTHTSVGIELRRVKHCFSGEK